MHAQRNIVSSPVLIGFASSSAPSVVMLDDVESTRPTRTITQHRSPTVSQLAQSRPHTAVADLAPPRNNISDLNNLPPTSRTDTDQVQHNVQAMEAAKIDPRFVDLYQAARRNAPRCGDIPLQWMTIAEAALTLRMSKAVLANWATRGYIATIKTAGHSAHRLVHLDNI